MTALSFEDISRWRGLPVVGADGAEVGRIQEIYLDDRDDQPRWALVGDGGGGGHLVPIAEAVESGGAVRVPYEAGLVRAAPGMPPAGGLSEEEEADLHHHYGLPYEPRPIELDLELEPERNPMKSIR